jgi:hypothetical protein
MTDLVVVSRHENRVNCTGEQSSICDVGLVRLREMQIFQLRYEVWIRNITLTWKWLSDQRSDPFASAHQNRRQLSSSILHPAKLRKTAVMTIRTATRSPTIMLPSQYRTHIQPKGRLYSEYFLLIILHLGALSSVTASYPELASAFTYKHPLSHYSKHALESSVEGSYA